MLENGLTVAAQSRLEMSKIATKKEQTIARALQIIRFYIGQVGAVTINLRRRRKLEYQVETSSIGTMYLPNRSKSEPMPNLLSV